MSVLAADAANMGGREFREPPDLPSMKPIASANNVHVEPATIHMVPNRVPDVLLRRDWLEAGLLKSDFACILSSRKEFS